MVVLLLVVRTLICRERSRKMWLLECFVPVIERVETERQRDREKEDRCEE